jgi:signal transduction histidine kinase
MERTAGNQRLGLFGALAALTGSAALLLDRAGDVEYGNSAARELLQCSDDDLLRAKWKVIRPLFALAFPLPVARVTKAEIPVAGGSRLVGLEWHALDAVAGEGHFVLLKDRGVLDPLEHELLLASERRGWTYRHETLLHDFKGILNSMQISLELLSDGDIGLPASGPSPETVRTQRRITALKADLARLNRALHGIPGAEGAIPAIADFDVRDIVKEVFAALRQLVRRHSVDLRVELPEAPLPARGRREWISQALFNVAVHRLNSMRAGGRLLVAAALADKGVSVRFTNGVPDMRDGLIGDSYRLFRPGTRGAAATDLQVARSIFESHGGSMEIGSGDGDDTVFQVSLPCPPGAARTVS